MRDELPATHPNRGYEAWTSWHLHGSASKPRFDGYASDITRMGQAKTYEFPNNQESRTHWYHDHGVHHTAENAYMGLAAMYLMSDELEDRLPIPKGAYDLRVVITDKGCSSAVKILRYGYTGLRAGPRSLRESCGCTGPDYDPVAPASRRIGGDSSHHP